MRRRAAQSKTDTGQGRPGQQGAGKDRATWGGAGQGNTGQHSCGASIEMQFVVLRKFCGHAEAYPRNLSSESDSEN